MPYTYVGREFVPEQEPAGMLTGEFTSAQFFMDAIEGVFEGFTNGDTWNGWARPYFEQSAAEQVLEASEANGYRWTFDDARDVFSVRRMEDPDDYGPEEFAGLDITVGEQSFRVYPIGAYSWIWEVWTKA